MTEEVWYRPAGTRSSTDMPPTIYPIWYRASTGGRPETTINGHIDWSRVQPSREFASMQALRDSGICIRVATVGDRTPFDTDLEVDEGL